MTRILILATSILLAICMPASAADGDSIEEQVEIKTEKAGTLHDKIGESKKLFVKSIKISGPINGQDIDLLREMAGASYTGKPTDGKLAVVDLAEAVIKEGESYFYYDKVLGIGVRVYSWDNIIGSHMFYGCTSLTKVILPKTVISIKDCAFEGCTNLKEIVFGNNIKEICCHAFYGCASLMSLALPHSIEEIENEAFAGCANLENIRIYCTHIPRLGKSAFGIHPNARLFVPKAMRKRYWMSTWGDYFKDISETTEGKTEAE